MAGYYPGDGTKPLAITEMASITQTAVKRNGLRPLIACSQKNPEPLAPIETTSKR